MKITDGDVFSHGSGTLIVPKIDENHMENAGVFLADRTKIQAHPQELHDFLIAIAPYTTQRDPETWVRDVVVVTDSTRLSDFGLNNTVLSEISHKLGMVVGSDEYLHEVTTRMANNRKIADYYDQILRAQKTILVEQAQEKASFALSRFPHTFQRGFSWGFAYLAVAILLTACAPQDYKPGPNFEIVTLIGLAIAFIAGFLDAA